MASPLLKTNDVAEVLGIGRTKVYELLKSGELHSVRVGRLRRVPQAALEDYLARLDDTAGRGRSRGGDVA